MKRWRSILGMACGALLMLSAVAHSLMGWPELRIQLELAGVTMDLLRGLQVAWHFGGVAMLAMGLVVLLRFRDGWRGKPLNLDAPRIIGVAYLAFGLWALLAVEPNPFYAVFVVPGALLLLASSSTQNQ